MSIAGWITLGFSILLLLIVVAGFLFGLKRGLKRSGIRLGYIAICLVFAGISSYLISGILVDLRLSFLNNLTLAEYSAGLIRDLFGNSSKFNPTSEMISMVAQLILTSILFVITFLVFWFITYIIFACTNKRKPYIDSNGEKILYKDKKGNEKPTLEIIKHRWWGALIGTIQGFLIAFTIAVPFSGIGNIVYKINSTASATSGNESTNIIEEFIPAGYADYLSVYNKNVFNVVFGWMNIDQGMFNLLTTKRVDGEKLSITNEILTINSVFETASEYGVTLDNFRNDVYNLSNSDFNKFMSAFIDQAVDSTLAKQLIVDYANYQAENAGVEQKAKISDAEWNRDKLRFKTLVGDNVNLIKNLIGGINVNIDDMELSSFGKVLNTGRELSFIGSDMFNKGVDKLFKKFGVYDFANEHEISVNSLNFSTCNFEKLLGAIDGAVKLANKLESMGNIGNKDTISAEDLDVLATLADEDFDETVKAELDSKIKDYISNNESLDVNLKAETDLIESAVILSEFLNNEAGSLASAEAVVQAIEADEELLKLVGFNNNAFVVSEEQYQALVEASQGKTFALDLLDVFTSNTVDVVYYDSLTNKVLYTKKHRLGDLVILEKPECPYYSYGINWSTGERVKMDDYGFSGWYLDGTKVTEAFRVTKSVTLTAKWHSYWTDFY